MSVQFTFAVRRNNFRIEAEIYRWEYHRRYGPGWRFLLCDENDATAARLLAAKHWGEWLRWPWLAESPEGKPVAGSCPAPETESAQLPVDHSLSLEDRIQAHQRAESGDALIGRRYLTPLSGAREPTADNELSERAKRIVAAMRDRLKGAEPARIAGWFEVDGAEVWVDTIGLGPEREEEPWGSAELFTR